MEFMMGTKPVKLSFSNLVEYRKAQGLDVNQSAFWRRIGITQSGGSRYETGRNVPKPVQLLLALIDLGIVTDESLEKARKLIIKANQ
jgi:transcriptional regulator with XRE-family HTH domain